MPFGLKIIGIVLGFVVSETVLLYAYLLCWLAAAHPVDRDRLSIQVWAWIALGMMVVSLMVHGYFFLKVIVAEQKRREVQDGS